MSENTWGFTGVKFHPEMSGVIFVPAVIHHLLNWMILLMAEILHQLIGSLSHYL